MKPVCMTNSFGTKRWYLNGKCHREDGPAVEYISGTKYWYINGKYHREDGPAVENADGSKEWYYQGKRINCKDNKEFIKIIKMIVFL
jgi:hypothetical protein